MKRFLSLFLAILLIVEFFLFCGGYTVFDFAKHIYVAGAAWAVIFTLIVYALIMQYEKILALEKRIKELEENK